MRVLLTVKVLVVTIGALSDFVVVVVVVVVILVTTPVDLTVVTFVDIVDVVITVTSPDGICVVETASVVDFVVGCVVVFIVVVEGGAAVGFTI